MAAKILKVTFAKWNRNATAGIVLTTPTGSAFEMHDVVTPTGLDLAKKTATSIAAANKATITPGTDLVIAEPVAAGATYIVAYLTKDGDQFAVEQEGSAS